MATLQGIGFAGFRSYSAETMEKVDFQGPLTLIWGKNGSGKTTIIEVLKYITTGALPPNSEKGKNFLIHPKMAGRNEVKAEVRLKFRAFNGRQCLAKRTAIISATNKGHRFESVEQIIKTKDTNGEMLEINHHCSEIEKQIPMLLGISKPVLQNIIFCHQDESLWPFSESGFLKGMFDELFETQRQTKIIEAYWNQHKEYIKQIKQGKKPLEYMKRLYDEDNKKKMTAIQEMSKFSEQALQVRELFEELNAMKAEMQAQNDQNDKLTQRKYEIANEKGRAQQKLMNCAKLFEECQNKIRLLNQQYCSIYQADITICMQDYEAKIKEHDVQMVQLVQRREEVRQMLEQCKNVNACSQKQMQIMTEIKRAKQCLDVLKRQAFSEQQILVKLSDKCRQLQSKKQELSRLKQQHNMIVIPNLLDLEMRGQDYEQKKHTISKQSDMLDELNHTIMTIYGSLYRPIQKRTNRQYEGNIQQRLKQNQMKLKMKQQELEKYKSMPKISSIKQKIHKLKYTGMEVYDHMCVYCQENNKCSFCSKAVSKEELKAIKDKCEKIKARTARQINELQTQLRGKAEGMIDPEPMIAKLTQEIGKIQILLKELSQKYQWYLADKRQSEQAKINDRLANYLSKIGLVYKNAVVTASQPVSLEAFMENVNKYQNLKMRVDSKKREIKNYEDRVKRNIQIKKEKIQAENKKRELSQKIGLYEEQTRNYQMLSNITKRLGFLLKAKGKNNKKTKKGEIGSQSMRSYQDIGQQLRHIEKTIRGLQIEKEYLTLSSNLKQMGIYKQQSTSQIESIEVEISEIDKSLVNQNMRNIEMNKKTVEYQTRKRQINLKSEIAFQEYHRPIEQQYLLKRKHMADLEAAAKDLEITCKAMQNGVSRFHRDKMDEVNKIIAEIWKQIYHGNDIRTIQIQALIDQDSKKKKNYHYSIVMQKSWEDNKVEMRGRCSMGQKVLASIVIRLALAEVFSNSTLLLALDEPTTNLDREHINNLAGELGRLLELANQHMQMIIISHDIEFIQRLENHTKNYFEVSRDERGFSIIKNKEIREIFAER